MNLFVRVRNKLLSILLLKIKPSGYYAIRSIFDDLKQLVGKEDPFIIDGGANSGNTTKAFLSQYKQPTVYCFEANPDLTKLLEERFLGKNNVHIMAQALGNQTSSVQFNISKDLPSSSFLERTELHKEYHGDTTATQATILTKMVRLDDLFENREIIDLLKLDVEGYELEALKGAENILSHIRVIMVEVWFVESYKNAPYFSDIEAYLRKNNFTLLNLYNPYTHPNMQLTAADAVFINKSFFPRAIQLTTD
jgi:FkbM family methyltransferase